MNWDRQAAAVRAVLAVVVVATVVVVGLGLRDGGPGPVELWFALVGVVLPVVGIVLQSRRPGVTVDEAASALAQKVTQEWRKESRSRGLYEERRMAVRWRREPGSERSSQLSAELPDEGVLDQLTGAFTRHARAGHLSRLVVTGEPGAGKTALCVLLSLEPTQPGVVPVLFPLSSWDPTCSLTDWMTDELARNHPAVGERVRDRRFAEELLREHVLPVLDGLDEASDRAAALHAIQEELVGRSFVLTCRAAEFAGLEPGRVLRDALVVRLQPLRADEAGGVLERAGGEGMGPLLATLDAHPDGPVARALETPFMLSLAVALGGALPEELLRADDVDAEQRIKRYLLGNFVTEAYRRTPDNPKVPFPADEAWRYLSFLARQAEPGTHRFAWWHLHRSVPRGVFLAVAMANAALACSAAAVILFALFERPWLGLWIGLGAAVVGALVVELVPQDAPRRAKPRLRSVRPPSRHALQRVLGFGAMGGAACAVIVAFLYERPVHVVVSALLSGLTFAAARYFSEPSDPLEAVTPVSLLRSDRTTIRYAWLTGAVPGALTGAYLGAALKEGRRTPQLDDVHLIDALPSAVEALLGAASGALLSSVGLGMMALGSSAWGRFLPSRAWLALRGHTPRRLILFAEDARERGVLRQVNGYYEFRHSLLHRHLADTGGPAAPSRSPAPAAAADTRTGPASSQ
ncbi:NACHT domain-containing protein [Streptomyces sp. CA-251387]|uniref:NACHT domain-containing protein n=1 Tax=Streptomyces sp. CA-251387 TaxID=3240064 RepID=UPI003D92C9DD